MCSPAWATPGYPEPADHRLRDRMIDFEHVPGQRRQPVRPGVVAGAKQNALLRPGCRVSHGIVENLSDGATHAGAVPSLAPEGGSEESDKVVRQVHRHVAETPQVTGPPPRQVR